MSRSYSTDLRIRVIEAISGRLSTRQAAARFGIGVSTAVTWYRRYRETGEVSARKQGQPGGSKLDAHAAFILALVRERPDISLAEIAERRAEKQAVSACPATIWYFFDRRGISFKKTAHAAEQERPDVAARRQAWFDAQPDLDPEKLIFIDETGASTKMARLRGRAKRGERCRAAVPHGHWKTTTFTAGLRLGGLSAPMLLDGPMDGDAFRAYVKRYRMQGIEGLHDELRTGRPRTHDDERVAEVINTALQTRPPDGATHWSVRAMAEQSGVSKSTVQRWFSLFAIQPHRQRYFKLSNDPFFVEKVRDIVGLYLNPPDHAVVLCVDEKTQVQALNRTKPMLPMGLGYVEGFTHDYVRHGTTTLFAALDIATGQVITQCKKRHRHQEFLAFLRHIDANVPEPFDVHLIADNYATHKHPKVRAWLARRPRYHIHYTPTYASWLNQVERWFGIITQTAIRRGSFSNVRELMNKIDLFVHHYNAKATPFMWTATAESILAKVRRLCSYISGTQH